MSDLRTRIAALIYDTVAWRSVNVPVAEEVADAVIRELNLAKACDSGCVWQIPNHYEDMTLYQRELLKRTDDE